MQTEGKKEDYYSVLCLECDCTQDEIRRAYFRLVRKHPPEKDPEGFKRIRQAFETLSDEKARRQYDALWTFGGEITSLLDKALDARKRGNYAEAAKYFKRLLVLNPDATEALNQLGICLFEMKRLTESVNTFERLLELETDVPLYHVNFGQVLFEKYRLASNEQDRHKLLFRARNEFRKAIELDSLNPVAYIAMAQSYLHEQKHFEALHWAERAVDADGKVDFDDFQALFFICRIYALSGNSEEVLRQAGRINEIVPDDSETRKYVAAMFAGDASSLMQENLYTQAYYFMVSALMFDPQSSDYRRFMNFCKTVHEAHSVWERFEQDSRIIRPVKGLGALAFMRFVGKEMPGGYKATVDNITRQMSMFPAEDVRQSFERIRISYPEIYHLAEEWWDDSLRMAVEASRARPYGLYSGTNDQQEDRKERIVRDRISGRDRGCAFWMSLYIVFIIVVSSTWYFTG